MSDEPPGAAGLDLARPRSAGAILAATLRVYRRHPLLFLGLALAVIAPFELAVLLLTGHGPLGRSHETALTRWVIFAAQSSLVAPLISALHMHAVMAVADGRRVHLREVARKGVQVLPLVGATDLIVGLGEYVGFLALFIPGLVLALTWAVAIQVAAVEREGVKASLRRSMRLTGGRYRHVFGLLLIVWLIAIAGDVLAHALPLGTSTSFLSMLVGIAFYALLASFFALTLALLYLDLRARHVDGDLRSPRAPSRRLAFPGSWQWGLSLVIGVGLSVLVALGRRHYAASHLSARIFAAVIACLLLVLVVRLVVAVIEWMLHRIEGAASGGDGPQP